MNDGFNQQKKIKNTVAPETKKKTVKAGKKTFMDKLFKWEKLNSSITKYYLVNRQFIET